MILLRVHSLIEIPRNQNSFSTLLCELTSGTYPIRLVAMSQRTVNVKEITQIREQLQSSAPTVDLPYDSKWAHGFIHGETSPPPEVLRDEVVIALVEVLTAEGETAALTTLAQYSHKGVAKAARKGLHQLRSKKVDIAIPRPASPPSSGTGQVVKAGIDGMISMYDHRMHRSVWLPHEAPRGLVINRARISAENGLLDFEVWASSRKKYREMRRAAREHIVVEEVAPGIVRWFIHQAARQAQLLKRGLPAAYTKSSQLLGPVPELTHPAEKIAPAEPAPAKLANILQFKALSLWVPEQEFMRGVSLKVQEITTSRIIVDDRQRKAQISALLEKSVEQYFTPSRIQACRRVLMDTAHLLLAGGNHEEAARVKAGAELFARPEAQVWSHGLSRMFIERVLGGITSAVEDKIAPEQPQNSLIIPG